MAQETVQAIKATSGNLVTDGPFGKVVLTRGGVHGLRLGTSLEDVLEWPKLARIDVYEDHAYFTAKDGRKVRVDHPREFDIKNGTVNWYLTVENYLLLWARQSGPWTCLRNGTPAYNLDVPPVFFHCASLKDYALKNVAELGMAVGTATIKKSFAYHYEVWDEVRKIKAEEQAQQE